MTPATADVVRVEKVAKSFGAVTRSSTSRSTSARGSASA